MRIFTFPQGIVRYSCYSGRANWCLGSFNTTLYSSGEKRVSNEEPCSTIVLGVAVAVVAAVVVAVAVLVVAAVVVAVKSTR